MIWNLFVIFNVVPLPLREFAPRFALSALFGGIGILALFESVYLAHQAAEFGSRRIATWLRVFRAIALVLFGCSVVIAVM
jgi:hypothetical protein